MPSEATTVAGLLFLGLSSVSTVVVYLWRKLESYYAKIEAKLDECERDRNKLWDEVRDLRVCVNGKCDHHKGDK